MLFANDAVLLGESREELKVRLETWRQALEAYDFRLSGSKMEYMKCNFSGMRSRSTLEVKVGDHMIPQVTRFKYLGSIVQNDGEIEVDVSHRIQSGLLKWRRASGVLCDKKAPLKLNIFLLFTYSLHIQLMRLYVLNQKSNKIFCYLISIV